MLVSLSSILMKNSFENINYIIENDVAIAIYMHELFLILSPSLSLLLSFSLIRIIDCSNNFWLTQSSSQIDEIFTFELRQSDFISHMNVACVKINEIFLKWILKANQHHLTYQLAQSEHIESKFEQVESFYWVRDDDVCFRETVEL